MNKYIQQFLDDNDLQAGERFYILDKDYKKMRQVQMIFY